MRMINPDEAESQWIYSGNLGASEYSPRSPAYF